MSVSESDMSMGKNGSSTSFSRALDGDWQENEVLIAEFLLKKYLKKDYL